MSHTGSNALWKVGGGTIGLVAVLVILVAGNAILSKARLRADLTEEKLYTLSEGTRTILKKLDQNVTLKLFFSRSASEVPPYIKNYASEVEDLLREYAIASGGRVTVETYDPTPDSDAEEWAQRYGISGQSLDMFGPPIYFGLVAVMGSTEAALPSLDPNAQGALEYNITRLIYRMAHPEKPVIGVLSSLPVMGQRGTPFAMPGQPRTPSVPPWMVFQDIGDDYTLREIAPTTEKIEPDVKSLIIIHPKDLPPRALYAINQFVLGGGRAMVFLDPLCMVDMENAGPSPFGPPRASSDLQPLLTAWGVTYEPGKILADLRAASRIRVADDRVEESPVWLTLGPKNVNKKDVLTSQLEHIMLPFAGSLSAESSKEMTVTPLIMSSESSCSLDAMTAQFGGPALRGAFKSGGVPLNIALRMTGKFKTAFPNGKPKNVPAEGEPPPAAAEPADAGLKEGASTVILVADVDMIYDRFCVQEMNFLGARSLQAMNDNLNFFANALEQVAGSEYLIGVRTRGQFARPFDKVVALRDKAMTQWQQKEKNLEEELKQTQEQLREMQASKDKSQKTILSEPQRRAILEFQKKEAQIKKDLRQVQKDLTRDITQLGIKVKVINIGLVPVLVCIAGVGFWLYRRRIKVSSKKETP